MKHERLAWSDEYSVGEPSLDEQHKNFCDMANEIIAFSETENPKKEEMLVLLTKLGNHILYHFDTEEEYLEKMDIPEAREHVKKHDKYREVLKKFIAEVREDTRVCTDQSDCKVLADKVATFVSEWVSKHMLGGGETEKLFAGMRKKG